MTSLYAAAQELHHHGILTIPVRADHTKAPALKGWQQWDTTLEDLAQWFDSPHGHTAMGVVTGPRSGNLEMAEIEGAYAFHLPALEELARASGMGDLWDLLHTGWMEESPSGGLHWFYRVDGGPVPGNVKIAQDEPRLVDGKKQVPTIAETRGAGGQSVGAPTGGHAHETGRPWIRVAGGPATVPTLTMEQREAFHSVLATLDQRQATGATAGGRRAPAPAGLLGGLEKARTTRLRVTQGATPGDDFEAKTEWPEILEPAGWRVLFQRGHTTYWQRPGKTDGGISATTGNADDRDRLFVFSSSTEFPAFEPVTKFSAYATLHHDGDHAKAALQLRKDNFGEPSRPQPLPAPAQRTVQAPAAQEAAPAADPAQQPQQAAPAAPQAEAVGNVLAFPDPVPARPVMVPGLSLDLTDDSNAITLIREHGESLRYDADKGRWMYWDGVAWNVQASTGGMAREMAKNTARRLAEDGPEGRDKMLKHKRYSLSERGTSAMLNTARTEPSITVSTDDLDAWPLELNTPGGIVDLTTGRISPPDPAKLHTRSTKVAPDPHADSSFWDQFLVQTFPDPAVRAYMKRLAGHSILGEVRVHVLPFAHGSGGNGKGVFLEALRDVLGTYAGSAPSGFLMSNTFQQHATELADLAGRRFVICSEINPEDKFDEAKVKALTGGDTVKARFMRQDFFEFRPTHHLWLMGNDQPAVESGGNSFWRRLRLIPFTHEVPEEKKIDDLQGILAREHGAAIMQWLVEGAAEFLADGMNEPESVKAATSNYAESVDTVGRFIQDACNVGEVFSAPVIAIRAAYEDWCQKNGEKAVQGRSFATQLSRHGVLTGDAAPRGMAGVRLYGNIALLATPEQQAKEDEDRSRFF